MRRPIIASLCAMAALPLLAGCDAGETDEAVTDEVVADSSEASPTATETSREPPTEPITMAGTAWDAIDSNGAVYTTFIDPEGTYRDFRDGEMWQTGSWDRPGGNRICYKPDDPIEEEGSRLCWTVRPPGEDGVMVAIDENGREVTVRQVEYVEPEDASEG